MHEIVYKEDLNSEDYLIKVKAPLVAKKWRAGQFVVLRLQEKGERVPMSVQKVDGETITMFIKKLGKTSYELYSYKPGDTIKDVIGPMGNPIEMKKYGNVVVASDLVCGHAENYAASKALRERGNHVISIQGFPTKDMIYFERDLKSVSDEYFITTKDGSYGRKGLHTDVLKELLEKGNIDIVFAGGTFKGLKRVADITKSFNIPSMVTLRTLMVDASGMCGACRVFIDGKMKLTCVDGPMFDAHKVNFDEIINRNIFFEEEEAIALKRYEQQVV
jgi:ferredoxin--NADP+ reductase